MLRYFSLLSALLFSAVMLVSCTQPEAEAEESQFRLLLTDAPADEASELMVTFGAIKLIPSESEPDEAGGVVTVSETVGSFDVLKLRNGKTELLSDTTIPNGSYSQLRLIVKEATITVEGEEQPITIPSGAQSGLKINIEPPLSALDGQQSIVTLDFNAKRVIQTGNGAYKLSPTAIRATSVSGTLQGSLVDSKDEPLAGGLVSIKDASGTVITETSSDADGSFKIITLTEGVYSVEISLEGYVTQSFAEVAIMANTTAQLSEDGNIVLIAEEEAIGLQ